MKFLVTLFFSLFLFFTSSCERSSVLQEWMAPNGKVKVLCTTEMVAELVREVGKDKIDCLTLIQGESDPHSYQLVKGDDEKIKRATLIFYSGLGLEHGPSLAERLRNNPKAFSLGDAIAKLEPKEIIIYNGSVDPHIWMDISLWQKSLNTIVDALQKEMPEHQTFFSENASLLKERLDAAHKAIVERFQKIPEERRYLVSAHEAFNYFVRVYLATEAEQKDGSWTKRSMAPEGLAPESQLSTQDIQRLVTHIVHYSIKTLFAESNVSQDSLKKLVDACEKMGYPVHVARDTLYVDSMGPKGQNYIGMMEYDAKTIAGNL